MGGPGKRCTRGYVVVLACFGINTLMMGYVKCFGILFVEFIQEFNSSASMTSAVMGLTSASTSLMSLIALNALMERLSIRTLALAGAVCASAGVILSSRASGIEFLFFSQSFLLGSGQGMIYGPGIVLIGQYFKRRRTLATAVATSGISAGAVLLPLLLRFLLDVYSFRGALLIMGGVLMEMLVFAALYSPATKRELKEESHRSQEDSDEDDEPDIETPKFQNNGVVKQKFRNLKLHGQIPQYLFEKNGNKIPDTCYHSSIRDLTSDSDIRQRLSDKEKLKRSRLISYSDSICLSTFSLQEIENEASYGQCQSLTHIVKENLLLFKKTRFLIIAGCTFFGNMGTCLFPAFVPPLAREIGLTDVESALLLSLFAGLDFVSRLASGAIAEMACVNRRVMLVSMFFTLGLLYQFSKFYSSLTLMIMFVILFGSINGIYPALVPAIILDFLGPDKFSKVFGFVQVFHGSGLSIAYPLLGLVRDMTGTYTTCFYLLGASQFAAGLILLLEPFTR